MPGGIAGLSCISHSYEHQDQRTNTKEARCFAARPFIHIEIPTDLHHHGTDTWILAPVSEWHIGACKGPVFLYTKAFRRTEISDAAHQ